MSPAATPAQRRSEALSDSKLTRPRNTATFEPYFWEAYNEIVQPHRFDWYLVTRWLPDLGPDGFALVKALRNLCYFNPKDGALRDTCQITVDELAEVVGMKRASVYRVLNDNEALKAFVQRQPEAIFVEGRTRRLPPRFRVCMDTPIHHHDLACYEQMRLQKERERAGNGAKTDAAEDEKRKSQIEIYERRKSQMAGRKSQNTDRKSHIEISFPTEESLPSGTLLLVPIPTSPASTPSQSDPPEGEEESTEARARAEAETESRFICLDPLAAAWRDALALLAGRVNKPTYETHLRPLRLSSVEGDAVEVLAPHAATRDWIEKRHLPTVQEALSEVLGRKVVVRLRLDKELRDEIAASLALNAETERRSVSAAASQDALSPLEGALRAAPAARCPKQQQDRALPVASLPKSSAWINRSRSESR